MVVRDMKAGRVQGEAWLATALGAKRVRYITPEYWAVCGSDSFFTSSFCVRADVPLYPTREAAEEAQAKEDARLAAIHARYLEEATARLAEIYPA